MNKYIILKKSIAIVLLCCIMLSGGGCTVVFNLVALSTDKKNKSMKDKTIDVLSATVVGASLDYLWYTQAQKYQAEGESKSRAYGKGALVTYGVFFVVGMIALMIGTYYGGV